MHYNVTIIKPKDYPHSLAFLEAAEGIVFALREIGIDCDLSFNTLRPRTMNVIFGAHLLNEKQIGSLPDNTIIFNTEPLINNDNQWNQSLYIASKHYRIWDYSNASVDRLKAQGATDVHFFQFGYQPELNRIKKSKFQDIDLLFYGSMNPRRKEIFMQCQRLGLTCQTLFGVYGAERDTYIARSKIVANLHAQVPGVFEAVRVTYLMNNEICFASEINDDTHSPKQWLDSLCYSNTENFPSLCAYLATDENTRNLIAKRGRALLQQKTQSSLLRDLLLRPSPFIHHKAPK